MTDHAYSAADGVGRISGPTILLSSGHYYDYENPENSRLTLADIAYGLGFTVRFRGQCVSRATGLHVFYSVADHCEIMSRIVPQEFAYDALMHEIGETVCGDMPGPLKVLLPDFKALEKRCEAAGFLQYRVAMTDKVTVKKFDMVMLATEQRDLMTWGGERWEQLDNPGIEPLPFKIVPRSPEASALAFMERFNEVAPPELRVA